MMNKAEWDAMEADKKDGIIGVRVMGWRSFVEKSGYGRWYTGWESELARKQISDTQHFTTDRNACALVLDKIERRDLVSHYLMYWLSVSGEKDVSIDGRLGMMGMWRLLRADPDLCCYCAVRTIEAAT